MTKLDKLKLGRLSSVNDKLDSKYGAKGTPEREEFDSKSISWYYGEILRDRRKALNLTQQELARKIGKERSYIGRIEKGNTDMQLSSFISIARALDLDFNLGPVDTLS